ncbi:hypothetical protein GF108_15045 [Phyllobacterium sp. SYP-B3895]|nr:hypothetical protein [Phyllobacterium sp. SYP-B3895]
MKFTIKNHRLATIGSQIPFVASSNVGGALAPKFIVIHYTASGPDADIARYFSQKSANVAAHLVVPRDGSICQCVPFDKVAWHAGQSRWTGKGGRQYSGLNNSAIGIEIENWGPLKKSGAGWVSWTGAPIESQKVIEARHKFGAPDCGWEVFTTPQLETVIAAVQATLRRICHRGYSRPRRYRARPQVRSRPGLGHGDVQGQGERRGRRWRCGHDRALPERAQHPLRRRGVVPPGS